jgi:hypothetical protein
VLEPEDHRIITYRTNGQTTIRKDGKDADFASFQPGDRLTVDSLEDDEGYYTATSVTFEKAGTAADRAAASQTWDLPRLGRTPAASSSAPPTIRRDPGDDRPVLAPQGRARQRSLGRPGATRREGPERNSQSRRGTDRHTPHNRYASRRCERSGGRRSA